MTESLQRVQALAELARLDLGQGLSPQEAEEKLARFAAQFKDMVALIDTVAAADTGGVEPLYWPLAAQATPLREDVARKDHTREELFANAPDQDGRFFVVPRIV